VSAIVLATVGTDVHPFDRVVGWLDAWAGAHPSSEVVIQYGSSAPPSVARGIQFLSHDALLDWMARATVVITHGGPASIMEVRARHGTPIVVPRNPELGEHVDRHQLDFCTAMARRELVLMARNAAHLDELIGHQLHAPPHPAATARDVPEGVEGFAREVDTLLGRQPTGQRTVTRAARQRARRTR
jgi:UDP-N-acetylglucosamine transferase subunit ALG13